MESLALPSLITVINIVIAFRTVQGIHGREPALFLVTMWAVDTVCTGALWIYLVIRPDTMLVEFFTLSLFVSFVTCLLVPFLLKKGEFTGMSWMVARRYGLISSVLLPSLFIASFTVLEWMQYAR